MARKAFACLSSVSHLRCLCFAFRYSKIATSLLALKSSHLLKFRVSFLRLISREMPRMFFAIASLCSLAYAACYAFAC